MDDTNKTCRAFVAALSSADPTPGGGGAAALCGAVGAALCGMVAHLTVGKKTYAAVQDEIQQLLESADRLQQELLDQVSADAEGFLPLSRAYAIPKDDPARAAALHLGLTGWVANNWDGSVTLEAQGRPADLDALVPLIVQSNRWAQIDRTETTDLPMLEHEYGFDVKSGE